MKKKVSVTEEKHGYMKNHHNNEETIDCNNENQILISISKTEYRSEGETN